MSFPGSPMHKYFKEENSDRLYSNAVTNIYTRMENLKQKLPLLQNNKFLNNFTADYDIENGFYGVKFEGTSMVNSRAKEDFTKDIERLLYSPEIYIDGYNYSNPTEEHKKLVNNIKSIGIDLVMNNFLISGFNITPQSYHDIIPARYLNQKQDVEGNKISISEYLQNMQVKMKDENFFNGFNLIQYMSAFGGMKSEGIPLVNRVKSKLITGKTFTITSKNSSKFIFAYNPKTYESSTFVKLSETYGDKNVFLRLKSMFKSKKVYTIPSMQDKFMEQKPYDNAPGTYRDMLLESAKGLSIKAYDDYRDEDDTDTNTIESCTK